MHDREPATGRARRCGRSALLLLSFASGAADVLAVVVLGGAFAGIMTGNLVLLGAAAAGERSQGVWAPALALGGYLLGTVLAVPLTGRGGGRRAWPRGALWCLGAETVVLASVAVAWTVADRPDPGGVAAGALLVPLSAAMGAQATTVLSLGREGAPTTFFTSTLTSLVAGFAARQPGVDGWAVARLACLFAGACGAVLVRRAVPDVALFLPAVLVAAAVAVVAAGRRQ
ncbi:YoaK family protein [Streptomyces sp. CNQ431]|uniref:YoaK family protein n=1 Tax=Streptomyces sp. CNQ431 TaxID=1571532 RepID=UPI000AB494EB|nr:YoaK family protein [Streptomyces sp. CNQ431]